MGVFSPTLVSASHTGIVKKWISDRGFGFIKPDDEDDECDDRGLFCHCKQIDGGNALNVGDPVFYDMGTGRSGKPCADNVSGTGVTTLKTCTSCRKPNQSPDHIINCTGT